MRKYLKSQFIKNALVYSGSNIVVQFIRLVKEFVLRRIIPPEIMGYWNLVAVVQGFIGTFDLGCIAGAHRELPMIRGEKDQKEEVRIRSTTLWFVIAQNIVFAIFTLIYVGWYRANYVPWEIAAICIATILVILNSIQSAYMTFYAATQAFVPLSKLLLISTIFEGVSVPLCGYVWGLSGVMVMGIVVASLKNVLFLITGHFANLSFQYKIFWDVLKRLLSFGFILRLVDYPYSLFSMFGILWVTKFMDVKALALFSLARSITLQVIDVISRVGTVFAMRFLGLAGSKTPSHIMNKQLKQYLLVQLLIAVPLVSWSASIFFPFIVRNFIPKYSDANPTILILLISAFFYVQNCGLAVPWIMEKRLAARGIANLVSLIVMVAALAVPWFFFERRTINVVAYATLAGRFFHFVYMVIAVGKDCWRPRDSIEIILCVTGAALWSMIVLRVGYLSIDQSAGFSRDVVATLFMGGWTLLLILPIPLYGLKRSHIAHGWAGT